MIYKHMYIAYVNDRDIVLTECEKVSTATLRYYEGFAVLYFETADANLVPDDFAKGSILPLPDGRCWIELAEIFHCFEPVDDSQWERKLSPKSSAILVNHLERDMISSYIYYHVEHQNDNPIGADKFMSIFIFEDIIFLYLESPTEKVTWDDIKGRNHHNQRYNWGELMNQHFRSWPDGKKEWKKL